MTVMEIADMRKEQHSTMHSAQTTRVESVQCDAMQCDGGRASGDSRSSPWKLLAMYRNSMACSPPVACSCIAQQSAQISDDAKLD
eukprot:1121601-Rhodomonas_salina.1